MSSTLTPSPTPTVEESASVGSPADRLLHWASVTAVVADLLLMTIIGEVIPPLAVFAVATVITLVALRGRRRAQATVLAVIAIIANAGGSAFWTQDIQHPVDTVAFLWAILSAGGRVVAILAWFLGRRGGASDRAARLVSAGALGLLAIAIVTTLVVRGSVDSDVAQPGDTVVDVRGTTFPDTIAADSGSVLLVDNVDPFRHTFTVEDTDLDVALDPGAARRIPVDLPPGSYQVFCSVPGHELMTTTLEVGP